MEEKKNLTKIYVGSFVAFMVILSLVLGYIMGTNMSKDTSKLRHQLTQDYKKWKDLSYEYNGENGAKLYSSMCMRCHQASATGNHKYPPLLNASILTQNEKLLKIIIRGFRGQIERNGKTYNSAMPAFGKIDHEDMANLLNYLKNEFSTQDSAKVSPVDIISAKVEALKIDRPYTEGE